jgi:predicted DNA-binding transcriptional regulator AlpA
LHAGRTSPPQDNAPARRPTDDRALRIAWRNPELAAALGLSRTTMYGLIHAGPPTGPRAIRLGRAMEQLGHSQVALTLNRNTHVPSAFMEEAAHAMDRALGS